MSGIYTEINQQNCVADFCERLTVCFRVQIILSFFCLFISYHIHFRTWDVYSMFYYIEETKTKNIKYLNFFATFTSDTHCMPRRVLKNKYLLFS